MIAYCREGCPNEVCGILGGRGNSVSGIWRIRNVEASPVSFLMDPEQQFQTMKSLRNEGLSMVALFHSHPDSSAYPSARDVALAFYDDTAYIIVGLIGEEPQVKAFLYYERHG